MSMVRIPDFLAHGHEVTVITPDRWLTYSGMAPGYLGGLYDRSMAQIDVQSITEVRGGRFRIGRAAALDPAHRRITMGDGSEVGYDALSCNIGSATLIGDNLAVEQSALHASIFPVKPVEHLIAARAAILHAMGGGVALRCSVIGSGAGAFEVAGNLLRLAETEASPRGCTMQVTLYSLPNPLAKCPNRFRRQALASLTKRGASIERERRVRRVSARSLTLSDGSQRGSDFSFIATGVAPPALFGQAGLPAGADGGLLVNRYLQSVGEPAIFGGGDCITFAPRPLDRVGVYAVRQNEILAHNLLAWLDGDGDLQPFRPQRSYFFALNLGEPRGVGAKWNITLGRRISSSFKQRFDCAFVRRFRAAESGTRVYPIKRQ